MLIFAVIVTTLIEEMHKNVNVLHFIVEIEETPESLVECVNSKDAHS